MADQPGQSRELVFCHSCQNEWYRDEHGIQCPRCQSEFVEVIEADHDPRDSHADEEIRQSLPPLSPMNNHNPWGNEVPDPDEGDIEHVEWTGAGGIHFSRVQYRGTAQFPPRTGANSDPFAPIFQTMSQLIGGQHQFTNPQQPRPGGGLGNRASSAASSPRAVDRMNQGGGSVSPLQEGPSMQGLGGRNTYTTTARMFPQTNRDQQQPAQVMQLDDLHGILGQLLQGVHGQIHINAVNGQATNTPPNPFQFFQSIFNPANASSGDAVFTQEALDRVISQLMEQHAGSSAPGPATASAIAALPKKSIDKKMMGSDAKAECSVCMDNVELGDEVTVLPCGHWFHGECVGAWLREHDTCPQCRQGIMPKEPTGVQQSSSVPRSPGQAPLNNQNPWDSSVGPDSPGSRWVQGQGQPQSQGSGSRSNPYTIPSSPSPNSPPSFRSHSTSSATPSRHHNANPPSSHHPYQDQYQPSPHPRSPPPQPFPHSGVHQSHGSPRADRVNSSRRSSRSRSSGTGNSGGSGGSGGGGGGGVMGWVRNHLQGNNSRNNNS